MKLPNKVFIKNGSRVLQVLQIMDLKNFKNVDYRNMKEIDDLHTLNTILPSNPEKCSNSSIKLSL